MMTSARWSWCGGAINLTDHLVGAPEAKQEVARYAGAYVSTITWIEVIVGMRDATDEYKVRLFLPQFERVPVDEAVADMDFRIRRQHRLKLPDAIIWASAKRKSTPLVTRNPNDFPDNEPDIRFPYRL
jgi:predicted nucleic acid-binding protein